MIFMRAFRPLLLLALSGQVMSIQARAQGWMDDGTSSADAGKRESGIQPEKAIERRRVVITQRTTTKKAPAVFREELEWQKARTIRLDQKTQELITQLETLSKRPGQQNREGELKMRLAELYFDRAVATSVSESEGWEASLRKWEALPDADKQKTPRPALKTPQADAYRRRALLLYQDLERSSRGGDRGASRMIQRDEVLFYLGITLMDLGQGKEAAGFLEEAVRDYPQSGRSYAVRLRMADYFFETSQFQKAVPHYLKIATGAGAPADGQHLKAYGLYKLGWCYMNLGENDKAVLAFKRTLDASRENPSERRVVFEREALNDLTRAFALAGQWDEGEAFFKAVGGEDGPRLLREFRVTAAETARDRGDTVASEKLYARLLENYGQDPAARDWALERAQLLLKGGRPAAYAQALEKVAREYGPSSEWLSRQSLSEAERKLMGEESSALLRRESKSRHNAAQRRNKTELYQDAEPFYAAYFRVVPSAVPDAPENIHEMRFYYGELLYRLGRFDEAEKSYAAAGEGKYGAVAAYNRILAAREVSRKTKSPTAAAALAQATQDFVEHYPKDERANEMLYSSAQQSFDAGKVDKSLQTLREIVARTPDKPSGPEAAERILFIHEKNKNIDAAIADADAFAANAVLIKTGGPAFAGRVRDFGDRARFKKLEQLPEVTPEENAAKGRAYQSLAASLRGDLREKALNNAVVYAGKGGDASLRQEARDNLVKDFPTSAFVKDVYGERADQAAREGRWGDALANYRAFLKNYDKGDAKKADPAVENALWNILYIRSHVEGFWPARPFPEKDISKDLVAEFRGFLARFPRAKARPDAITVLALRKGATSRDIAELRKLPSPTNEEKNILEEGDALATVRGGPLKEIEALTKRITPDRAQRSALLKDALGAGAFRVVEPRFQAYTRGKLDPHPQRFVKSLQKRLTDVEALEKDYMRVVTYGSGSVALQSLERLARLFHQLAGDIDRAANKPEERDALAQYSKPLRDKGLGFLKTCFEKAVDFKIGGTGLSTCRATAREFLGQGGGTEAAFLVPVTDEILADPRWVPQVAGVAEARPLVRTARQAFAAGRYGEFLLADALASGAAAKSGAGATSEPLTPLESGELENLKALLNVRLNRLDLAAKTFRSVSDMGGAELAAIRTAALKNLAGLYSSVGDFALALDTLNGLVETDPDVAWMKGLGLRASGKVREAVAAYQKGLDRAPNNPTLLFNLALAQAAAGDIGPASTSMQKYVEIESPAGSHPSRALLRKWKGMTR